MERAVLFGDAAADTDSSRLQSMSLLTSILLSVLAIGCCAAVGWLRPQPGLGDAVIMMDRTSGALYVRVDDTVHPVTDLTSARLIAQTDDDPRQVAAADLAGVKHGPLLGIPGAPAAIGPALSPEESAWTVCNSPATTIIAGVLPDGAAAQVLGPDQAVLVSSASGRTYLLYDGRRALLDLAESATVRALRLDERTPRLVSDALLSIVPEVPRIAAPAIPDFGSPGPVALAGFAVGDVFRVEKASSTEYFVVLAGGVQRIGAVTADLIRFSTAREGADITAVAPSVASEVPTVGVLPVADFPDRIGAPLNGDVPAVCASWTAGQVTIRAGALPVGDRAVPLAQADGGGPAVDAVFLPPGRSAYIGSTGIAGATGSVVTEAGVRYAVGDADTARMLGLPDRPVPAPWPLLAGLPSGPELRRDAAFVARDVAAGPP